MSDAIYFTIIVLNWNGYHFLHDCLNALRKQTFKNYEVIVVDNGSVDGSGDLVRSKFPEVRLIELKENLGFSVGNNHGFEAAMGDYIIFLNNDTVVHPNMLQALHYAIQHDSPNVAAWASKMLRWDDHAIIDNCGCAYSIFGTGVQIGYGNRDESLYDRPALIFGASGGSGCYRRAVLNEIGVFDEDFFYNNEDVDLNFRLQLAGYQCRFVPESIVYHRGSATAIAESDRTIYHILRNKVWVFYKNMPNPLLIKYLVPHIFYNAAWLLIWTFRGRGNVALRAYWHAVKQCRSVLRKRRFIQKRRRSDWRYIDNLLIRWRMPVSLKRWLSRSAYLDRKDKKYDTGV
jgi:GT2 family glycosyltransferase